MEKPLPLGYYLNNGEPDKTGYQQLALSAFYKAVSFHPNENTVTLGPKASSLKKPKPVTSESSVKTYSEDSSTMTIGHGVPSKTTLRDSSLENPTEDKEGSLAKVPQEKYTEEEEDNVEIFFCESPEEKEEKLIRKRILTSLENISLSESQAKINNMRREWVRRNEETMSRLEEELTAVNISLEEKMIDDFNKRQITQEKVPTETPTIVVDQLKLSNSWEKSAIKKEGLPKKCDPIDKGKTEIQQPLEVSKDSLFPIHVNQNVLDESHSTVMEDPHHKKLQIAADHNQEAALIESEKNKKSQLSNIVESNDKYTNIDKPRKEEVNKETVKKQEKSDTTKEMSSMEEDVTDEGKKQTQETKTVDPEAERILSVMTHYKKYWKIYSEMVLSLKEFLSDDSLKKFRTDCQKAVNVPVNAISGVSAAHLADKLNKLTLLLSGSTVLVNNKSFNPSQHPLGLNYCTYLLAEKIVKQGEDAVSVKSDSAFPIALVTLEIWKKFPNFGELLIGAFHKKCPYLIPIYWIKENEMTNEEYYRKLGFKYDGNERENIDMFLKRQGGIVRLYFSIVISPLRNPADRNSHPLPLSEAWRWLAMFTAFEPSAEITATLLYDMLDVTGNAMLKTYGKQFLKLIYLICVHFVPKIEKVTPEGKGGPVSRLKSFLEKLIRTQAVNPPKGILSSNFW